MSNLPDPTDTPWGLRRARSASWTAGAFYLLVAFEFFYMVSPFAAYVYGVYGPGLDWLAGNRAASWLVGFFLPHVVARTTSPLVDAAEVVGAVLFVGGVLAFVVGAVQIYAAKLRQRGSPAGQAVEGGVYRWVRHPQYLALMAASFGMVLVWPRFLVLFGFVTVVFAYVALARAEERACLRQFPGYAAYRERTGMFVPRPLEAPFRRLPRPRGRAQALALWALGYAAALGVAALLALAVRSHAVGSLYTHYTANAAFVSVGPLAEAEIAGVAGLATRDPRVAAALRAEGEGARFINYVLPTEVYVSEIPMHLPAGAVTGHTFPRDVDRDRYKVIFTRAEFAPGPPPPAPAVVRGALDKEPVVEAWVDRAAGRVTRVLPPPTDAFYDGMPVPVF
jgi:protein-S-isoprenylcysteine O-methyltransferase Ste14